MTYDFPDLSSYSADQLAAVQPDLARLAAIMRHNLRSLDLLIGIADCHSRQGEEHDTLRAALREADALIEFLEHDVATARAWIEHLERKLATAEDDGDDEAYRVVGLAATAHTVVVAAARRTLLRHYHPDHADEANKAGATAQFARLSAAFDRIAELRG